MTTLLNQFDIKYIMKKKLAGRKKINVIESIPYSEIIFLISSGNAYASKIAEARGKKDSSPTLKQLYDLEKRGFVISKKEQLLNKTNFEINWNKIIEEFSLYVLNETKKKTNQATAYYGAKYDSIIKKNEKELNKDDREIKDVFRRQNNEKKAFEEFEELHKSKRLTKNKYFKRFFEILFSTASKIYIKKNVQITIKEIFDETKQIFGFQGFDDYVYDRMMKILVYRKDIYPRDFNPERKDEIEKDFEEVMKRYSKLKKDYDLQDIITLGTALRFAFGGHLINIASSKVANDIMNENNLITESEWERYKKNTSNHSNPNVNEKNKQK